MTDFPDWNDPAGVAAAIVAQGAPPAVQNYKTAELTLQVPGIFTMYTFTNAGRIWKATVAYAMGSSGGTGSNQGYSRVKIQGGNTLAIVECVVVSAPAGDSEVDMESYNGFAVPSGTVIQLDVNNNATITGVVQRASALIGVSIP